MNKCIIVLPLSCHLQGQKIQANFDKELSNLNQSVKQNMQHLEEIADARAKLQAE